MFWCVPGVDYLILGADLTVKDSGALPPYETVPFWKTFDIDVIGGVDPVFVAKSADGHVSRMFLRRTGDGPSRRRIVR